MQYNNGSHTVIPVSPTADDNAGPGSTGTQGQGPASSTSPHPPGPPIPVIAGAVGGGAFVAAIFGFILWRRRSQAVAKSTLRAIPSDPSFHGNELDGGQGGHQLVSLPPAAAGRYDEKSQYPNDTKTDYWAHQPPPQPQGYHEMASNQVGVAVSPSSQHPAHAPSYAELPVQHPAAAHTHYHHGPAPTHERYEMM